MELKHFSHHHPLLFHHLPHPSQFHCSACKSPASGNAYACWQCSYFLHEQCFRASRSFKHPSHPLHPLTLVPSPTYPSGTFFCNSCHLAGDAFSYCCSACEFDIHVHCALAPNPNPNPNPNPHLPPSPVPEHNCNPHPQNPIYPPIQTNPFPSYPPQSAPIPNHTQSYPPQPTGYPQVPNSPYPNVNPSYPPPSQQNPPPAYTQPNPTPQNYPPPVNATTPPPPPPPQANPTPPTYSTVVNATTTNPSPTPQPTPTKPPTSLIKHFSHPHVLKAMEIDPKNAKVCSACECELSGSAYCCTEPHCTFNLHKSCFDSPREVRHKSHLQHPLSLLAAPPYEDEGFTCNACLKDGKAFVYTCGACSYDLHIDCIQWPDKVTRPDHKHALALYYSSPAAEASPDVAFMCDVCANPVHEMAWLYYCRECDFGTHLECVTSGIKKEENAGGAAGKTQEELMREVELNFAVLQLLAQGRKNMV